MCKTLISLQVNVIDVMRRCAIPLTMRPGLAGCRILTFSVWWVFWFYAVISMLFILFIIRAREAVFACARVPAGGAVRFSH